MIRNNTAVYVHYTVWDAAANAPKAGDVANHTLKLIIDGVVSAPTNAPTEVAVGEYKVLLTAAETIGAKFITVAGVSATADVYIIPSMVITDLLISGAAFIATYTAWDIAANAPKTGDVANHTMTIAQDATSAGASNAPAEVDAVNTPGLYKVSVTAGEATGHAVSILGVSSTADINIMPTMLAPFTVDYSAEADTRLGTAYAEGTLTGTLDLPSINDVRDGTQFDNTTKEGNLELPAEADVEIGVSYGTLGTEFTGLLSQTRAVYSLPQELIIDDDETIIYEGCD